jgi:two-component system OmpR family sensor kinase
MFHLLGRVPLRIKLVAAILVLVTAAMLVISTASTFAMRSYLVSNQMDGQLKSLAVIATAPKYANAGSSCHPAISRL